ncbi:unnamed protein product [Toxocara canis]|uniref:Uncharacterized protein n=1 Tax=Toxocara canis TaxID=6265 RepID=A0A183U1F8_TOXCA|nr:unnamed protein product [Toxocara canis]
MGLALAIVIAIILAAIAFFYKASLFCFFTSADIGVPIATLYLSHCISGYFGDDFQSKQGAQSNAGGTSGGAQVTAEAGAGVGAAQASPEAPAPSAEAGAGAPVAPAQVAAGSAVPEPDVNTAKDPTNEEMNKYAKAAAEGSTKPESDVYTAKDPTKEEMEIALKKKEASGDLIELPGEAAVAATEPRSAQSPEMASSLAQPRDVANQVAPTV